MVEQNQPALAVDLYKRASDVAEVMFQVFIEKYFLLGLVIGLIYSTFAVYARL